ncbi:MAG: asparagine synthase (glutamine-hydrolyzing) [Myxococcales bacterium]|nr:MAG: asparagine synthase (glutamine-hydrolyzing) [Myxococcales bacterium]
MCGIVGELSLDGRRADLERTRRRNASIVHRGPDEGGDYLDPRHRCALAMRRLSIVDLSDGTQPMHNEDSTVWVVFNGEIYNHAELRSELEGLGHTFATDHSDTEVIVHGYEAWGEGLIARLRGMFGLAVWDENHDRLLVARDRLGKKPIYYAQADGRLVFGSELRTILEDKAVPTHLDVEAVDQYLKYQFILAPHTLLAAVKRLPAAHLMVVQRGNIRIARYWEPPLHPENNQFGGHDQAIAELEELLIEAVTLRVEADVPVGTLLSGGLDSSLITAMAQRVTNRSLHTFSVGFAEASVDESDVALQVSREIETQHHPIVVDQIGADLFSRVVASLDEPLGDPAAVPTYLVSELAASQVKVVLTGEGGDEMFAGYDVYGRENELAWMLKLPRALRRSALACLGPVERDYPRLQRLRDIGGSDGINFHDAFVTRIYSAGRMDLYGPELRRRMLASPPNGISSLVPRLNGSWDPVAAACMRDVEIRLPEGLLMKVDKMTMAHSLEARTPFLDHRLAEWALRVPSGLRRMPGSGKLMLKEIAERHLPHSVVHRKKHPFEVPIGTWLRGNLREVLSDSCSQLIDRGFSVDGLARLQAGIDGGQSRAEFPAWLVLVLGAWLGQHREVGLA